MKKHLLLFVVLMLVIFSACSAEQPAQTSEPAPETQQSGIAEPEVAEPEPEFDLDAYKGAVSQFRKDVMDNSLPLYNVGKYEVNYLKILGGTSENTVDNGFEWLAKNADATRESVDAAHQTIRDEYAGLILVEVDGKEAETLDEYVRNMYEGYSALYDCVTSNSFTSSELTDKINNAVALVNGADSDMGLFLD